MSIQNNQIEASHVCPRDTGTNTGRSTADAARPVPTHRRRAGHHKWSELLSVPYGTAIDAALKDVGRNHEGVMQVKKVCKSTQRAPSTTTGSVWAVLLRTCSSRSSVRM